MSTQSIKEISLERYGYEAEQNLKRYSGLIFAKKHFKIGDEVDRDKMLHYMFIDRITCENNCELIEYINKKIKGEVTEQANSTPTPFNDNHTEEVRVQNIAQWENVMW